MEDKLLATIPLDNGLTVYFYDLTRPIVGGRCQARLLISIPVKVEEHFFEGRSDAAEAYRELNAAFGESLTYQQEKTRNFVALASLEEVLGQMKEEFLQANRSYFSQPHFAAKYVLKKWDEWKEQQAAARAHQQTLQSSEGSS